jgi:4-alpha-glucanotransferase
MVSGHSADLWARQDEFRHDASVGVPPDAFSETGQDWGVPAYRWDVIARTGYEWLAQRARRCAELFDAFRVDHLVGFYRTFVRERDGTMHFVPSEEAAQRVQGEAILAVLERSGARIIAEDLGLIPDFVRESLAALNVPGLKVLRWEREWQSEGRPFRDPESYPRRSVAISSTHDTETLAEWWDSADPQERAALAALPTLRTTGCQVDRPYDPLTRDALLTTLFRTGSDFVILPLQDIFGWRDRINTPASVGEQNWTWRLPWPVEDLMTHPIALERARFLRPLTSSHARRVGD